jgi:hypothetical protein
MILAIIGLIVVYVIAHIFFYWADSWADHADASIQALLVTLIGVVIGLTTVAIFYGESEYIEIETKVETVTKIDSLIDSSATISSLDESNRDLYKSVFDHE